MPQMYTQVMAEAEDVRAFEDLELQYAETQTRYRQQKVKSN